MLVLREPWRPHPLAWIHRAEAKGIAGELGCALKVFSPEFHAEDLPLLRLSDPVMLQAVRTLSRPYLGPCVEAMERCYDKREAYQLVAAAGIDCPGPGTGKFIAKPRRGSDSIGLKLLEVQKPSDENTIVQEFVPGTDLTVAVLHGRAGAPLQIDLPPGTPYTFMRKYLARPSRAPLADSALAERVRHTALGIADLLGVDWAARVDFIHVPETGRLCFLECDVAPLIGAGSAFSDSFLGAGMSRRELLEMLTVRWGRF